MPQPTRGIVARRDPARTRSIRQSTARPRRRRSSSPPPMRAGRQTPGDDSASAGLSCCGAQQCAAGIHDHDLATAPRSCPAAHREQDFSLSAPMARRRTGSRSAPPGGRRAPPWIMSNPIYVGDAASPSKAPGRPPAGVVRALLPGIAAPDWRVEHDATSVAAVDRRDDDHLDRRHRHSRSDRAFPVRPVGRHAGGAVCGRWSSISPRD